MNKMVFSFFIFWCVSNSWAQEETRKILKGKVTSEVPDLEGIYVVNRQTESVALTEKGGYFSIMAKEGDTLMFSAIQIKGKQIGIGKTDFGNELLFVKLEPLVHALDEVKIIRYDNINAVALGIIPKGQKSYTPAERKLKTATSLQGTPGVSAAVAVDPLLNWMSGRTAMLRKEVEVEKKEFLLKRIEELFEAKFFTDQLKIPALYVKGFQYFLVENPSLVAALNSKNKTMASFIMAGLAVKYNDTIACDAN